MNLVDDVSSILFFANALTYGVDKILSDIYLVGGISIHQNGVKYIQPKLYTETIIIQNNTLIYKFVLYRPESTYPYEHTPSTVADQPYP